MEYERYDPEKHGNPTQVGRPGGRNQEIIKAACDGPIVIQLNGKRINTRRTELGTTAGRMGLKVSVKALPNDQALIVVVTK